jgi:phosphoribosylanthranilate isomerase
MASKMNRVKVKICGMTRQDDVRAAADAGTDMLGFVFAPSPRQLSPDSASSLLDSVPAGIVSVALFMNQPAGYVNEVLESGLIDLLQFHGDEDNEFCASFGLPFIKAIAMGDGGRPEDAARVYPDAQGLLYDSHVPGGPGGSGDTFDWGQLPRGSKPVWLAGGLTPINVAAAVRQCKPWAVDVSSGVEDAPGVKNRELVEAFIRNAKSVKIEDQRTQKQ